jgi:hypothetical protein
VSAEQAGADNRITAKLVKRREAVRVLITSLTLPNAAVKCFFGVEWEVRTAPKQTNEPQQADRFGH